MQAPLIRFLFAHGANALATGVHLVVLAWVAVVELKLASNQWGIIQATVLLPNICLMLVAGAWADRTDPAKVFSFAQLLLTFSYLGLLVMVMSGGLSFYSLIIYGFCVGVGNAFVQPVREKLVTEINSGSTQKRVSLLSITQFSMQSVGIALAALSDSVGVAFVVGIQAGVSALSCITSFTLRKSNDLNTHALESTFTDIQQAVQLVWRSSGLRQLMALIAFNGYMHLGVFLVLIPIVATRTYHYNATEYASLQLLFVFGMITAHFALLRQKTVAFPGQGALFSLLYTALIGFGLAKGPTPMGFYCLVFFWGLVAGNSAGRCRLVLQSLVPADMKGRVMAVYQLMLFGFAPLGALVTGYVLNYLTIDKIFGFMSGSSIILFVFFMMSRTLWSVEQVEEKDEA